MKNARLADTIDAGCAMLTAMGDHICNNNLFCDHRICKARLKLADCVALLIDEAKYQETRPAIVTACDLLKECLVDTPSLFVPEE